MSTPTAWPTADTYVTPECAVGREHPGFKHGCPSCPAPGYQHPVLKWVKVECACPHHTEETP